MIEKVAIVVPCFNEAERLNVAELKKALLRQDELTFVFVNDGSSDETGQILRRLESNSTSRVLVVDLPRNLGKAEAVRLGVLAAVEQGPDAIGYWDADLATPIEALANFVAVLNEEPQVKAVIGSRIKMMGRRIDRRMSRHYSGRVFATLASLTLGFPVYDSQCGAKLFRMGPELLDVFKTPFISGWAFDVEVLARMAQKLGGDPGATGEIVELPLQVWRDIPGSKVGLSDWPRMASALIKIRNRYP